MKDDIAFEIFDSIDIRVGKIIDCQQKEGSEKLLRLTVDFGNIKKLSFQGLQNGIRIKNLLEIHFYLLQIYLPEK